MTRNLFFACVLVALAACDAESTDTQFIDSAKELLGKQDINGAVIQLKNALDKNPNSAEARFLLGKALLQGGDPSTALIELRKAQDAKTPDEQVVPEIARALLAAGDSAKLIVQHSKTSFVNAGANADLQTSLAAAHAMQGKLDQARALAAAALQAQPGYTPAVVLLARLDASTGDIAGALRQLDQMLANESGNAAAGLLKGEILLRARNDPDAALASLRSVQVAHPESVAAQLAVVNILMQQSKASEARTEFEQLKKIGPRHPGTLMLQAQFAFDDKDYKASREITERLLAAMPDHVPVLLLAGAAEYHLQHYLLAVGLLGRALKIAPNLPMTRHLLAQTYLRVAQPDKAIGVLQPLVDAAQADATSLALAGEAYLQAGDSKRSEAAFQRALKAAPDDAKVRTSLAVAQLARGDSAQATAQAMTQLEAIAKGDSGPPQADMALVSARLRHNDLAGALLAIDGLEKKLPGRAIALTLRGRVLAQQGDMAGAAASFDEALAREPNYLPAASGLAAIDVNAGKPERARKRFEDMIQADPKNFWPHMALAELDARLGAPGSAVAAQLEEAARLDPSQPAPHLALIDHLLSSGDSHGALAAAQVAGTVLPNDLGVIDALGRTQLGAGDSQRAVSTFKRLVGLQPKNPLYQVRLAEAHMAGKDPASAALALRQALDIEPHNPMALRGLALLAAADQRPREGIAIARAMQLRLPKDAAGFVLEAEIESGAKNWAAAAAALSAALQRSQSNDLAIRLHRSLIAAGKSREADRMAADWQQDHPKDAVFIYYLGDLAAAAKDWPKAEAQYRAVVALQPRNASALNNVAWLLATQRKPGATALAEQANALLPERAPLLDTLALAQEAENQLPKAILTLQRAVELAPKDPMLRLRLARLLVKQGDKPGARDELEPLARLGDSFAGQGEVAALLKALE